MRRITVSRFMDSWLEDDSVVLHVTEGGTPGVTDEELEIEVPADEAIVMDRDLHDTIMEREAPDHISLRARAADVFDQRRHGGG